MNFNAFQEQSIEMGAILLALEEIEGIWQDGDSMGFVEDTDSEYYGSWVYKAANSYTLDQIRDMFTEQLGYDTIDGDGVEVAFYRMDTVVQIEFDGNEVTFYIDHSADGDFDMMYDDEED